MIGRLATRLLEGLGGLIAAVVFRGGELRLDHDNEVHEHHREVFDRADENPEDSARDGEW